MSVSASDAQVAECTARAVAGDRASYEALFRLRCAFVEAEAARRLGRRRDLVDDVAQDAWLRVARGPRRCPDVASLDAWLRRVVRSAAIDLLRSELACRLREERAALDRSREVGRGSLASAARHGGDRQLVDGAEGWLWVGSGRGS